MREEMRSEEAIACYGRIWRSFLFVRGQPIHPGPLRRSKLPCIAQRWRGRDRHRRDDRWRDRELRLTLAPDAITADPRVLARLYNIERVGPVSVDLGPGYPEIGPATVGRISLEAEGSRETVDSYRVLRSRDPHSSWGWQGEDRQFFDRFLWPGHEELGVRREAFDALLDALIAHEALENDLFVTTNPAALQSRDEGPAFEKAGVCTPREALTLAETFLRNRGHYVLHVDPHSMFSVDAGGFYTSLAVACLPSAARALSSCLAPDDRSARATVVGHLEAVISRFQDLLVAHDQLLGLAQEEGYEAGGGHLLTEQMYHLQNSVVLFTGALDHLALVAADLDGRELPKHPQLAWPRMVAGDDWWKECRSSETRALRAAAAAAPHGDLIALVQELRNTYQHNHPLVAGTLDLIDTTGVRYTHFGAVLLDESVKKEFKVLPNAYGIFTDGTSAYAVPHTFQRGMIHALAAIIEHVVSAVSWTDADWWRHGTWEERGAARDRERDTLMFLFGWGYSLTGIDRCEEHPSR